MLSKNSGQSQSAVTLPKIHQQKSQSHTNLDENIIDLKQNIRLKTDFDMYEQHRMETTDTLGHQGFLYNAQSPNFLNISYQNSTMSNNRISEKDSPLTKKLYSSAFKSNGARFSLNCSVNSSPKIFMRTLKGFQDKSVSNMSERSHFHFTRLKDGTQVDRYGRTKEQIEEERSRENDLIQLKKLNESDDMQLEDKKSKEIVGEEAVDQYYGHYKNLSKIVQQNNYYQVQPSLQTDILREVEKRNVIPSKLGLIKQSGEEDILKLSHMQYGDQYASVLSQGLKKVANIKKFHLQDNRISEKSAAELVSIISKNAKEVNLANNNIGKIGCENLSRSLQEPKCQLEVLNLEDNKLGDYAIIILLKGIMQNKSLKILNLSKNYITDKVCTDLKNILEQNELYELYLHWNLIKAQGGQMIFEGMKSNEYLKVFDISYNTLGKSVNKNTCAPQICEFITNNQELRHLDLSNNYFNYQDSVDIAAALEKNKTIYGFHFAGNVGYVDSRGFLIIEEESEQDLTAMHTRLRIDSCKTVETNIFRTSRDKDLKDCCWICEGWQEIKFQWKSGISGDLVNDPLFIHFNFEDFRGNFFGKGVAVQDGFSQIFTYERVIPPGELEYFFSGEDSSEIAKDQEKKFNYEGSYIPNVFIYQGQTIDVPLKELNYMNVHANKKPFLKYEPLINILPRTKDPVYIPPKKKKFKYKWTFPISLFAKWRMDDEELLRKCFDFDWDYGKIPKLIKNDDQLKQVKEFFRSHYREIKDCYKSYATKYPVGDVWAIQNPAFLEFIEKIKIIDKNLIKDPDINLKWVATISSIPQQDKTNPRNPVQAISRYQMMEVLVRIAEEKYILKYKTTNNYFEAVKMFWDEHLAQEINSQYNLQTWRNERYWNEECDTCLKNYKRIVEHVYKKFSKLKVKPGQAPFMCLEELQTICNKAGLTEEAHFGPNVALQAFNFSVMTQVDELQQDRIYQMYIVEFYEALARIAEAASLEPIQGLYFVDEEWNLEKRKSQILAHKLEALIVRLLNTLCDAAFKEKYPPINKSFFVKEEDSDVELVSP
ncbi:hypothetical protein ABPG74_014079 [Tetrahymena malaccensis]